MSFFETNGFRLHYQEISNAAPLDVIFLHGNLGANIWWEPTVKNWQRDTEDKKSLLLMEWRGSGQSQGPNVESDLQMEHLAEDVIALAKTRGGKVNLVGHSTGGLIALLAMAQRPDLFTKAVVLDPVGATGIQFHPDLLNAFKAMQKDRNLCKKVILGTILGNEDSELAEKITAAAYSIHPLNWTGVLRALANVNYTAALSAIPHPVLVLHGEHDVLLPKADSKHLAEILPQGKFQELPARGHCANVEDPALFAQITRSYLFG